MVNGTQSSLSESTRAKRYTYLCWPMHSPHASTGLHRDGTNGRRERPRTFVLDYAVHLPPRGRKKVNKVLDSALLTIDAE